MIISQFRRRIQWLILAEGGRFDEKKFERDKARGLSEPEVASPSQASGIVLNFTAAASVEAIDDQRGPPGLMFGSQSLSAVTVEVLVEQVMITPVRVGWQNVYHRPGRGVRHFH